MTSQGWGQRASGARLSSSSHTTDANQVPASAKWLGGLGLIPFVGLTLSIPLLDQSLKAQAVFALCAYGAVILSFLGGIRWGLAIAPANTAPQAFALLPRLSLSVAPSLLGWVALLLPARACLLLLAATFSWMLWSDLRVAARGEAPVWYPRLRWPLTATVVCALVLAALI